jgi:hypothetical protein
VRWRLPRWTRPFGASSVRGPSRGTTRKRCVRDALDKPSNESGAFLAGRYGLSVRPVPYTSLPCPPALPLVTHVPTLAPPCSHARQVYRDRAALLAATSSGGPSAPSGRGGGGPQGCRRGARSRTALELLGKSPEGAALAAVLEAPPPVDPAEAAAPSALSRAATMREAGPGSGRGRPAATAGAARGAVQGRARAHGPHDSHAATFVALIRTPRSRVHATLTHRPADRQATLARMATSRRDGSAGPQGLGGVSAGGAPGRAGHRAHARERTASVAPLPGRASRRPPVAHPCGPGLPRLSQRVLARPFPSLAGPDQLLMSPRGGATASLVGGGLPGGDPALCGCVPLAPGSALHTYVLAHGEPITGRPTSGVAVRRGSPGLVGRDTCM